MFKMAAVLFNFFSNDKPFTDTSRCDPKSFVQTKIKCICIIYLNCHIALCMRFSN